MHDTNEHSTRRWLRLLIAAYGLNLALFLVARGLLGERWTIIALLNSLLHLLLIPSLILLPVCLLVRRWRLALTLLPAAAAFLLSYGALFLPQPVSAAPAGTHFTLLTYNLHAESYYLDAMVEVIRQADADVVALQELSPAAAARFEAEFAPSYPYRALHPGESNPIIGQGLLSRFPIVSDRYWHIYLGHQRAELQLNGDRLTMYNTHPVQPLAGPSGFARRGEEIAFILEQAQRDNGPVILAGDFNMSDQADDYRRVTERFVDTYREVGWGMGFTWPAVSDPRGKLVWFALVPPLLRLDYVFHTELIQSVEARVWGTSGGSDHRPLLVRLALVNTP